MKRIKIVLCALLLVLCIVLAGCGGEKTTTQPEDGSSKENSKTALVGTGRKLSYNDSIIHSLYSPKLRDPFVLLYDGNYYVYGTGWTVCKTDDFRKVEAGVDCVEKPEDYDGCSWAPEVFYYKERFYMFTTYRSKKTGHRGCAIFVSDTPDGTFKLHSDGHITPKNADAIDGTLYIDDEGQPWMVFCQEWTNTDDKIGRIACAKMSEDLTRFITEPKELFRADDAPWSKGQITDGCFIYKAKNGSLQMLWSNNDEHGYCVGIATSESGNIEGPWVQQSEPLFSKEFTNNYDGGHGMIFTDSYGYMWLSIHSPNSATGVKNETPTFIPIKEENNRLVWDLNEREHYKKYVAE